jgi:tetratricopeptide (TPR) repeat protein
LTGYNLLPPEEGYQKAIESSERALAIDPMIALAHANLGWIAMVRDGDLVTAARYLQSALKLEPANITVIRNSGTLFSSLGRLHEAITVLEYVVARDPISPVGYVNLSQYYILAGRYDEAIRTAQTALSLSPGTGGAQYRLGEALLRKGEPEAAQAAFQLEEDEEWRVKGKALTSYELERFADFEEAFAELREKWGERWPIEVAHVYAWTGDTDQAFVWLDRELGVNGLGGVMLDNFFIKLHDDPRWQPFLEKAGVSEEQLAAIEFTVSLPE